MTSSQSRERHLSEELTKINETIDLVTRGELTAIEGFGIIWSRDVDLETKVCYVDVMNVSLETRLENDAMRRLEDL